MTHHCMNASIPTHAYGYVCREILYGMAKRKAGKTDPCVIFGVTSIPARALCFSILCESGAQWARIPLHMIRWEKTRRGTPNHKISDLQCWDNLGWDFSTTIYDYLIEMRCTYRMPSGKTVPARYWWTLDHTDNGYSLHPSQHKCYHLLMLEDGSGQIAAAPNNRILWDDKSFVIRGHKLDYRVMAPVKWHGENAAVNPQDTAITKD